MVAAHFGHAELVACLLHLGADVKARSPVSHGLLRGERCTWL